VEAGDGGGGTIKANAGRSQGVGDHQWFGRSAVGDDGGRGGGLVEQVQPERNSATG